MTARIYFHSGWRDVAYETIPKDLIHTRATWHAHRIQDEAKAKGSRIDGVAALSQACKIVEAEDSLGELLQNTAHQ